MILCAVLGNEFIIARYLSPGVLDVGTISIIRKLQTLLALIGIVILTRKRIAAIVNQLAQHKENVAPLVLSLIIPWPILFFMVEPNRGDRLWWLWPLQVVVCGLLHKYPVAIESASVGDLDSPSITHIHTNNQPYAAVSG